jgi:hypothetical protein
MERAWGRGLTSTIVAQEVKPIWQLGLPISMIASRIFLKSHAHRTMLVWDFTDEEIDSFWNF